MQILKTQKARLEKDKLVIDKSTTFEEWQEIGQALKRFQGSVQIWIGDWTAFGEKAGYTGKKISPETYAKVEALTGIERKTLQNYKNVAESTAAARQSSPRGEDVSFAHYREIASLSEEDQKKMITLIREKNLTTRQLREAVVSLRTRISGNPATRRAQEIKQEWEVQMRDMAEDLNHNYSREQRIFLIKLLNK